MVTFPALPCQCLPLHVAFSSAAQWSVHTLASPMYPRTRHSLSLIYMSMMLVL